MNLNQAMETLDELMLGPKEQKPKIRYRFGSILRETQNLYNELNNSSVPWSYDEYELLVDGQTNDYRLTGVSGKILFVTASPQNGYPYPVDFTDLADSSRNWWYYYPLTAARPEDYNFSFSPAAIAFYRKNGEIWARVPSALVASGTLTIVFAATGWAQNVSPSARPVLEEYQHLPLIRAAMNLMADAEWSDDKVSDEKKCALQMGILQMQEKRVYDQFVEAKRGMTADELCFIETNDDFF